MVEKSKAVRSRTLLGGVIAFNNRASTMDCQVRNLSAGGAKVTFNNTATCAGPIRSEDRTQRALVPGPHDMAGPQ